MMEENARGLSKKWRQWLPLAIILLFALLRLHYEFGIQFSIPFGDGQRYRMQALRILNDGFLDAPFQHLPGVSIGFLPAIAFFEGAREFQAVHLSNAVFLLVMLFSSYGLGRLAGGNATGCVTAALLLLNPSLTRYLATYYSEPTAFGLYAASLYLTARLIFQTPKSYLFPVIAAAATCLSGLTRPVGFIIGVLAALYFFLLVLRRRNLFLARRLIVYGLTVVAIQGGYAVRNRIAYGEWSLLLPGSQRLYVQSNNTHIRPDGWDDLWVPSAEEEVTAAEKFDREGRKLDFFLARMFLILFKNSDSRYIHTYEILPFLAFPIVTYTLLKLISLFGLGIGVKNRVILFTASAALLSAVFYAFIHVAPRYSLVLQIPLSVIAAYGLTKMAQLAYERMSSQWRSGPLSKAYITAALVALTLVITATLFDPLMHRTKKLPVNLPDVDANGQWHLAAVWPGVKPETITAEWQDLRFYKNDKFVLSFDAHLSANGLPLNNCEIEAVQFLEGLRIRVDFQNERGEPWGSYALAFYPSTDRTHHYKTVQYIPANSRQFRLIIDAPGYGDKLVVRNFKVESGRFAPVWKLLGLAPAGA